MYKSEEERKEARKRAQARYRLKQGGKVGCGTGNNPHQKGQTTTIKKIGDVVQKETVIDWRQFIPKWRIKLNRNSSIEDVIEWCMELAESLKSCPEPAAWASALNAVLKLAQLMDSRLPPPVIPVAPRPRITIEVEEAEENTNED